MQRCEIGSIRREVDQDLASWLSMRRRLVEDRRAPVQLVPVRHAIARSCSRFGLPRRPAPAARLHPNRWVCLTWPERGPDRCAVKASGVASCSVRASCKFWRRSFNPLAHPQIDQAFAQVHARGTERGTITSSQELVACA